MFLLPSFQIILFCLCVGRTPFDLKMGVVNAETNNYCPHPCDVTQMHLSCCFLHELDKHTIHQVEIGTRVLQLL